MNLIEIRRVANITHDRGELFKLADAVVKAAPERKWDAMLVDGNSGYYVGRFLGSILTAVAMHDGGRPPVELHVANSRFTNLERTHRREVAHYLAMAGLGRRVRTALAVTEYAEKGGSIQSLGEYMEDLGVQGDFAVMATRGSADFLRGTLNRRWPDAQCYIAAEHSRPPALMSEVTGYAVEVDEAEPQENPYVDARRVLAAHVDCSQLVLEYLERRFEWARPRSDSAHAAKARAALGILPII